MEPAADLDALLDRALELSEADTDDDTCLIAVEVLDGTDRETDGRV
ncbi:hypothetical protein [Kitasatospora griseola]